MLEHLTVSLRLGNNLVVTKHAGLFFVALFSITAAWFNLWYWSYTNHSDNYVGAESSK